jgi:hypothetical protein
MSSTIYIGKYIDSGSRNGFYHIVGSNRQYGFKEFPSKERAIWSHRVQTELSKVTAAPFVTSEVGRISLEDGGLSEWGYVTEVATKVRYCKDSNCCCDLYDSAENCPNRKRIDDLTSIMEDMGLIFTDGHIANFGMVKRNNKKIMVLIDTGVEGFGEWDETVWGRVAGAAGHYGYNNYSEDECDCSMCMRYANVER